jgi:hypothetical protein
MTTNPYVAFFESWLKGVFAVPASTLPTLTPAVAETDVMKAISEIQTLVASVKGLINDAGYQAKIRDGLSAALSADELVSIAFPAASVGEVPLTLAISALPLIFYVLQLKWKRLPDGTYMTPEFFQKWSSDPANQLNPDRSFKIKNTLGF